MIREINGVIVRVVDNKNKPGCQHVFVKDDLDGVIVGMSTGFADVWMTTEEAKKFANQILASVRRVERARANNDNETS